MCLIKCINCKNLYSEFSRLCPFCSYPKDDALHYMTKEDLKNTVQFSSRKGFYTSLNQDEKRIIRQFELSFFHNFENYSSFDYGDKYGFKRFSKDFVSFWFFKDGNKLKLAYKTKQKKGEESTIYDDDLADINGLVGFLTGVIRDNYERPMSESEPIEVYKKIEVNASGDTFSYSIAPKEWEIIRRFEEQLKTLITKYIFVETNKYRGYKEKDKDEILFFFYLKNGQLYFKYKVDSEHFLDVPAVEHDLFEIVKNELYNKCK